MVTTWLPHGYHNSQYNPLNLLKLIREENNTADNKHNCNHSNCGYKYNNSGYHGNRCFYNNHGYHGNLIFDTVDLSGQSRENDTDGKQYWPVAKQVIEADEKLKKTEKIQVFYRGLGCIVPSGVQGQSPWGGSGGRA